MGSASLTALVLQDVKMKFLGLLFCLFALLASGASVAIGSGSAALKDCDDPYYDACKHGCCVVPGSYGNPPAEVCAGCVSEDPYGGSSYGKRAALPNCNDPYYDPCTDGCCTDYSGNKLCAGCAPATPAPEDPYADSYGGSSYGR